MKARVYVLLVLLISMCLNYGSVEPGHGDEDEEEEEEEEHHDDEDEEEEEEEHHDDDHDEEPELGEFDCFDCSGPVMGESNCGSIIYIDDLPATVECTSMCMTHVRYEMDQQVDITRSCDANCTEGCNVLMGAGSCTFCCRGPSCNSAVTVQQIHLPFCVVFSIIALLYAV